jgi:hypothetical protein
MLLFLKKYHGVGSSQNLKFKEKLYQYFKFIIDWFPDRNLMLRVTNKINVFYRKKE